MNGLQLGPLVKCLYQHIDLLFSIRGCCIPICQQMDAYMYFVLKAAIKEGIRQGIKLLSGTSGPTWPETSGATEI